MSNRLIPPPLCARTLEIGDTVTVSHPAEGSVKGYVVETATPAQLPAIEGAPSPDSVREIMKEFGIVQVAFISYELAGERILFAALGDGGGRWCDLERKSLEIRLME